MTSKKIFLIFIIFISCLVNAQQENVPIDHDVYTFLKEMKVKGIAGSIHEDNPNMSRAEVKKHLENIDAKSIELSSTEKKLLKKFQGEFYDQLADSTNSFQFLGKSSGFSNNYSDFFSRKVKYLYAYREPKMNFYFEMLGRLLYGQAIEPKLNNAELFDIGIRARGTLFEKLGYSMTIQKGGVSGSINFAPTIDPRLNYNFKFIENIENISNYDFTEGYLRYFSEPIEDMHLAFQIGREKIKLGYGYGDKLVLSGNHPVLDFLRVDFKYGILSFTSITASTVGEFHINREDNFTKYYAYNKFNFSIKNFAELGLGETIIYSGRGFDLAYINPFAFYKFEEMSLQDRDNGLVFLDFQTNFLKNLEFQGTFFLDENILSHLQEMDLYSNKTAYQLGAFWYSPLSIVNLSLVLEYTKIRPYVYSHVSNKNSYTSYGQNLGHRIGPNADEIYMRASYNFNEWLRGNLEFQRVRSGENIFDGRGNLLFNAGGNYMIPHRQAIDSTHIDFLEGERVNQNIFTLSFRVEPIREVFFDLFYKLILERNLIKEVSNNSGYAYIKMTLEF